MFISGSSNIPEKSLINNCLRNLFLLIEVSTALFISIPQHTQMFFLSNKANTLSPQTENSADGHDFNFNVAKVLSRLDLFSIPAVHYTHLRQLQKIVKVCANDCRVIQFALQLQLQGKINNISVYGKSFSIILPVGFFHLLFLSRSILITGIFHHRQS